MTVPPMSVAMISVTMATPGESTGTPCQCQNYPRQDQDMYSHSNYPQNRPSDSLNEISQSNQHPPTETALILPPRGTTRGSAASFVGSAFGTIFGKNFGTICCNRSSAGRARSHGAAGRSARRSRIWRARRAWVRVCRRAPARQRQLRQGCVTRARKAPQHQAEGYLPRLLKSHGNVSAPCPAREPPTRSYSGTIQSAVVAPPE
jgi:hypothetical protein